MPQMAIPALIGSGIAAVGGAYQSHQARKAAGSQQQAWQEMNAPQQEYMRQMYPMQLEQMQSYLPYYQAQVEQQQQLLDPQTQLALAQMTQQQQMLPYQGRMMEEMYFPMMQQAYGGIQEYGAEGVQPWEQQAISQPFQAARTRAGERAAGAGTLRAGATQKLASLYDIAEAEALTQLPYQRKQQALQQQMQFLGYQPQASFVMTPGGVSGPGQIGVQMTPQPQGYQPQGIDFGQIGSMMGMMGGGQGAGYNPGIVNQQTGGWTSPAGQQFNYRGY